MTFMYSLIRPQGPEKNSKLMNVGPTSIPESRVDDQLCMSSEQQNSVVSIALQILSMVKQSISFKNTPKVIESRTYVKIKSRSGTLLKQHCSITLTTYTAWPSLLVIISYLISYLQLLSTHLMIACENMKRTVLS